MINIYNKTLFAHWGDVVKLIQLNYFYFDDCTQIYTESPFYTLYLLNTYIDGDFFTSVYDEIC